MSLFQSNLRKQIRNLPKILNFVKIIHYYSKLLTSLLSRVTSYRIIHSPLACLNELRRELSSRSEETGRAVPLRDRPRGRELSAASPVGKFAVKTVNFEFVRHSLFSNRR